MVFLIHDNGIYYTTGGENGDSDYFLSTKIKRWFYEDITLTKKIG